MSEEHLGRHLGYQPDALEETYPGWDVRNHEFWLPETFTTVGTISAHRIAELTGGLLTDAAVDVRINRHVAEADVAIVVGPVFPHEVVGFSGGNKYFFPGVSGPELINLSHWVGALITSAEMIGTRGITPVRALIDEAAGLIPARRLAFCLVVASGTDTLHAVAFGPPEDSWAACADVSAQTHVTYLEHPVRRVLSIMPTKYEDIWTAAEGFYKLEPIRRGGRRIDHLRTTHHADIGHASWHRRDRVSQPRLLPRSVGEVPEAAVGRSCSLHSSAWSRHVGSRAGRGESGYRHVGHRYSGGRRTFGEPQLPRPGHCRYR
jgi:lactate racemase